LPLSPSRSGIPLSRPSHRGPLLEDLCSAPKLPQLATGHPAKTQVDRLRLLAATRAVSQWRLPPLRPCYPTILWHYRHRVRTRHPICKKGRKIAIVSNRVADAFPDGRGVGLDACLCLHPKQTVAPILTSRPRRWPPRAYRRRKRRPRELQRGPANEDQFASVV